MHSFGLTDEQRQLQALAHQFSVREIQPVAAHHDREQRMPWEMLHQAFAVGLVHEIIPEQYGGAGLGFLDSALVGEELAWGCMGIYSILMASELGILPIILAGSEEQKRRWLPRFSEKLLLACFSLSEPGSGSDAGSISTFAERQGDEYIVTGTKCWATNGRVAELRVVFVKTDRKAGTQGITALVVEGNPPGLDCSKEEDKMGQRAANTAVLVFNRVPIPVANRLGAEGEGFKIAMRTLDKTRINVGAASVGLARRALEECLAYAKQRVQFG
ncbi:MAG: acyl-CoA dehydrogenase family protein, partial [Deinococcus sp.]|nr:acyl-CoA dehydrogenase family protein [Deinococcus sp.]